MQTYNNEIYHYVEIKLVISQYGWNKMFLKTYLLLLN